MADIMDLSSGFNGTAVKFLDREYSHWDYVIILSGSWNLGIFDLEATKMCFPLSIYSDSSCSSVSIPA